MKIKTTTFKEGDKFILEIGKRKLDKYEIAGTDYFIKISLLEKLIPYKPKEKTKKWEYIERKESKYDIDGKKTWAAVYKCPNCGFLHTVIENFGLYRYCPDCGWDMRGEHNEIG